MSKEGREFEKKEIGNRELPIWEKMPEIVETLKHNNRLILVSETGSGKTTQVPQALWAEGFAERGKIFVVENRVAVAVEIANRVAEEMKVKVGQEVGYLTGPEKKSGRDSQIVFMTSGVFKNIIRDDPKMEQASVVLFDEFDERYLLSDIGLALVEKAQNQGSKVKFGLMSATLNAQKFSEHFGSAPIVEAKGRPYPVETHYSSERVDPRRMPEQAARDNDGFIIQVAFNQIKDMVNLHRGKTSYPRRTKKIMNTSRYDFEKGVIKKIEDGDED